MSIVGSWETGNLHRSPTICSTNHNKQNSLDTARVGWNTRSRDRRSTIPKSLLQMVDQVKALTNIRSTVL